MTLQVLCNLCLAGDAVMTYRRADEPSTGKARVGPTQCDVLLPRRALQVLCVYKRIYKRIYKRAHPALVCVRVRACVRVRVRACVRVNVRVRAWQLACKCDSRSIGSPVTSDPNERADILSSRSTHGV